MNIQKTEQNGKVILQLEGWLDTLSSPELAAEVDTIENAAEVILDFDKVEYIASSGIRQVVACYKRCKEIGAEFSVINTSEETMSIFELTGIDKKLNISKKD